MSTPNTGMTQEELVEFLRVVIAGIDKMNRRQRWQMRRDMKVYSQLVNNRWPNGRPVEVARTEPIQSEEAGC